MAKDSKIEWTTHTFNPWRGCTKVSDGCKNCYAEKQSKRNPGVLGIWGANGTREVAAEAYWKMPIAWDAAAAAAGERHRVFCASLADVFEADDTMPEAARESVPLARIRLFQLIDATPHLDWLLLTKRPENVRNVLDQISNGNGDAWSLNDMPNVWLGTSVENQTTADERIPKLLEIPAKVRFLSMEPLLGPVDVSRWLKIRWQCSGCRGYFTGRHQSTCPDCGKVEYWTGSHKFNGRKIPHSPFWPSQEGIGLDWVIVGGESGSHARPMHPVWVRFLRDQCESAGISFLFKQWGEFVEWTSLPGHPPPLDTDIRLRPDGKQVSLGHPSMDDKSVYLRRVGKKSAGRELDGVTWDQLPG